MCWLEMHQKNFSDFEKNANWLCLVKDDYNKDSTVHRLLIEVENTLKVEWEKN